MDDLALMGIRPDQVSHTSDKPKELYQYCIPLIKSVNAHAEDAEDPLVECLQKEREKSTH